MPGPERRLIGEHLQRRLTSCFEQPTETVLPRPLESTLCISRSVRNQIRDKLPYPFEDAGEHQVKNIARPVRVFALSPNKITETEAHAVRPTSLVGSRSKAALLMCAGLIITGLGIGGGLWGWSPSRMADLDTGFSSQTYQADR